MEEPSSLQNLYEDSQQQFHSQSLAVKSLGTKYLWSFLQSETYAYINL